MLNTLLLVSVGVFIGWNFEQPKYVKTFQAWVLSRWAAFKAK